MSDQESPRHHTVNGKRLKCVVCGHTRFHSAQAQLNTPVATFFSLDWLNRTGECRICAKCGYIHWFLPITEDETE